MTLGKRYLLTAVTLVLVLTCSVFAFRFARNTTPANVQNLKAKGPKNALIRVIVYSDFQCPACRLALEPLEELRNQFADVMQIEFRHFPLMRAHRWALTAASFAECAAEQDKFWEFHDRLYSEQPTWSKSEDASVFFADYVQELNLDRKALEQCIENPKTLARIQREQSSGEKLKVESTPTFFINGQTVVGALQLKTNGTTIVLNELKKLGIKSKT